MTKIRVYHSVLAVFLILLASSQLHAEVSLNGIATHTELGKELFIAGLYTSTPSTDRNAILNAQEEKQLQVRVTADDLSSRRFKRMWIEGMAVNASPQELKDQSNNMAAFANMLKVRMIAGDIFTVERYIENGDTGVRVIVNGVQLGEIADPNFFDLLLRTWLGPVPLSSDFRNSLTQAGNVDAALLARYRSTAPSDARLAEVEAALATSATAVATVAAPAPASNNSTTTRVEVPSATVAAPRPPVISAAPPIVQNPTESRPTASEERVSIAPPKLDEAQSPATTPPAESKPATTKPAQPAAATTQVARVNRSSVLEDESDDTPLTAESIYRQQLYVTELRRHTYNYLDYPSSALSRGKEGNLRMDVVIDRQGNVLQAEIVEESNFRPFNREAQKAVKQADPFPPVPAEVKGETFTFTLPIVFILQN